LDKKPLIVFQGVQNGRPNWKEEVQSLAASSCLQFSDRFDTVATGADRCCAKDFDL